MKGNEERELDYWMQSSGRLFRFYNFTTLTTSTQQRFYTGIHRFRSINSMATSNTSPTGTLARRGVSNASSEATSTATGANGKPAIPLKMKDLSKQDRMIVFVIFAITGSSAAMLVRPALRYLAASALLQSISSINENSSFKEGPWAYRFLYFFVMWPMYSTLLLFYGTLFGRRIFFSHFVAKMWGRVLPKPATEALKRALGI